MPTTAVEVRLSRSGDGPLAVGLRRKLIILPESVLSLDSAAIEAVVAHEIAHHERRDLVWIALASALKAVAWFNPLAHLIARALVAAREDGTDDWAVRQHVERSVCVCAGAAAIGAHGGGRHNRSARPARIRWAGACSVCSTTRPREKGSWAFSASRSSCWPLPPLSQARTCHRPPMATMSAS